MKKFFMKWWYWLAQSLLVISCRLYLRVRIQGEENIPKHGQFLLLSNHQSYLDPPLCAIGINRRLCYMARDTLFNNWFLGRLIRSYNAIPVRRGEADIRSMKKIIQLLNEGLGVCLYPEGTRTSDGKIAKIKPGFSLLSRRGNSPVVPMVIEGMFDAWPRTRKFPKFGGRVDIRIGKLITAEQVKEMGDEKLTEVLNEQFRSMQSELRIKAHKEPFDYSLDE